MLGTFNVVEDILEALAVLSVCGTSVPAKVAAGALERTGLTSTWEQWTLHGAPQGVLLDDDILLLQPKTAELARKTASSFDNAWHEYCLWSIVEAVDSVRDELSGSEQLGALLVGVRAARRLCETGSEHAIAPYMGWSLAATAGLLQEGQYESARAIVAGGAERVKSFPFDTTYEQARLDWEVAQLDTEEALYKLGSDNFAEASLIVALEAGCDAATRIELYADNSEEPVIAWCCMAEAFRAADDNSRADEALLKAQAVLKVRWSELGEAAIAALVSN